MRKLLCMAIGGVLAGCGGADSDLIEAEAGLDARGIPALDGYGQVTAPDAARAAAFKGLQLPRDGGGDPAGSCFFVPDELRFGIVSPGRSMTLEIAIRAQGSDCEVRDLGVADFLSADLPEQLVVPAGEERRIAIGVTAASAWPAEGFPALWGTLNGVHDEVRFGPRAVEPCLLVAPDTVDFDAVGVGCTSAERTVAVINVCDEPLQLAAVDLEGEGLAALLPALPLTLARGAQIEVPITWIPTQEGAFTGALEVEAGDGETASLALTGLATAAACE